MLLYSILFLALAPRTSVHANSGPNSINSPLSDDQIATLQAAGIVPTPPEIPEIPSSPQEAIETQVDAAVAEVQAEIDQIPKSPQEAVENQVNAEIDAAVASVEAEIANSVEQAAYQKITQMEYSHEVSVSDLGVYPGQTTRYTGHVDLTFSGSWVAMDYRLITYDNVCKNGPTDAANSCGIHIHEGYDCSDPDDIGGHYYGGDIHSDPWVHVVYGGSSGSVAVDYGTDFQGAACRALVLHDSNGGRITCANIGDHCEAAAFVNSKTSTQSQQAQTSTTTKNGSIKVLIFVLSILGLTLVAYFVRNNLLASITSKQKWTLEDNKGYEV